MNNNKQINEDGILPGEVQVINGKKVRFQPPLFIDYVAPKGFLTTDIACHALFYYHQLARQAYERVKDGIELEGETTLHGNYEQLFASVARIYGIRGEHMLPFWPAVELQCQALNIPTIPNESRYRFNGLIRC